MSITFQIYHNTPYKGISHLLCKLCRKTERISDPPISQRMYCQCWQTASRWLSQDLFRNNTIPPPAVSCYSLVWFWHRHLHRPEKLHLRPRNVFPKLSWTTSIFQIGCKNASNCGKIRNGMLFDIGWSCPLLYGIVCYLILCCIIYILYKWSWVTAVTLVLEEVNI